ncbi:MAG: VWA domain-containing protein [Clostridia bacterium]|nr:VWA domain-containing protein [Clostridia bacterium]
MSIYEDFNAGDFAKSTKKRLPICFCLDTSGSMAAPTGTGNNRMQELNEAFSKFVDAMKSNDEVASSADIAIVTFGGQAAILQNFTPVSKINTPKIEYKERSLTPMGEAIQVGLKLLEIRKNGYKQKGMEYYQPWLVVLTDGEPEGKNELEEMEKAIAQTTALESQNKLVVFNIGIGNDADLNVLKRLSVKRETPISVRETNLDEVFEFLGKSSDTAVSGDENTDAFYGKEELKKGKEIDISEWCI